MKETYEKIDLEVLEINERDVITASPTDTKPENTEHDNAFGDFSDFM